MFPLALPAEVGVKTTPKVKLCPGIRVNGKVSPVRLNPVPVMLACVTVRLEPPELVSVSDSVWLLPTWTLPKLRLLAVAVSDPDVTPAPDSGMLRLGFEALLVMERLPAGRSSGCRRKPHIESYAVSGSQNDRQVRSADAIACARYRCLRDRHDRTAGVSKRLGQGLAAAHRNSSEIQARRIRRN